MSGLRSIGRFRIFVFSIAIIALLCACAISTDLDRESWCKDNGHGAGIVNKDGVYYCAGDESVRLPDYLQPK